MDLHRPVSSANSNVLLTVRRKAGERYTPHTLAATSDSECHVSSGFVQIPHL